MDGGGGWGVRGGGQKETSTTKVGVCSTPSTGGLMKGSPERGLNTTWAASQVQTAWGYNGARLACRGQRHPYMPHVLGFGVCQCWHFFYQMCLIWQFCFPSTCCAVLIRNWWRYLHYLIARPRHLLKLYKPHATIRHPCDKGSRVQ